MTALRALLEGIIDYAGLFPPAALDMPTAVRHYAEYLGQAEAWMLGRFVVPVARLEEFRSARERTGNAARRWKLAALLGAGACDDVALARSFNALSSQAEIDTLEGKLATAGDVLADASACGNDFDLFVEVGAEGDLAEMIGAVQKAGVKAKVRTG